jgi:hypothetical protein
VRELTLDDLKKAGAVFRRCVPDLAEVYVLGSCSLVAWEPSIDAALRTSVDVDFSPVGRALLYFDSKFVEQWAGLESEFFEVNQFYIDYVTPDLLRCTPPGWQERVRVIELAAGLAGHCLDPHDVAYNKLWAGRPKDILWVRGLIATGLISMERLKVMHNGNPIPLEDHQKVSRSMQQVEQAAD